MTILPFLILVRKSAIGSVMTISLTSFLIKAYQLDLVTPGSSPL
jgi:hypothetical protein